MAIYEKILRSIRKERPGLPPEALALPGAEAEAGARFSPGGLDHIALYHGLPEVDPTARAHALESIESRVREISSHREPDDAAIARLEEALDREDALAIVDDLLERISGLDLADWEPLFDALSTIALHTDRVRALKLSMAMLGPFQEEETIPFFRTMARHPEFSLFATTALANDPRPSARAALVALLDETDGWAKVDVVERLMRIDDLDLGEALITKGLDRTGALEGYLALGIAERCDLSGALKARGITRDTLAGACRLLARLAADAVDGGPAGTLDDLSDGSSTVRAFCERLPQGPADLEMAEAAAELRRWARARDREEIVDAAAAYLERPDLVGAVADELGSKDPARRTRAARLAGKAGMVDLLPMLEELLNRHPDDDEAAIAALSLGEGSDLVRVRDRLIARIRPAERTEGVTRAGPRGGNASGREASPRLTLSPRPFLALIAALPRLPDATSREILRTATADRDVEVRRSAFRALRSIGSDDPADRDALRRAADDPDPAIAAEAAQEKENR